MARTEDFWETGVGGTYLQTIAPLGFDILINGTNKYLNFNSTSGSTGYGFRDNNGVMEVKDDAGSWTAFADLATPGGADTSIQFNNNGAFDGFGTWNGSLLDLGPYSFSGASMITDQFISLTGDILIEPLAGGDVKLKDGTSSIYAVFDTSLLTTADKTFTFPDATGTIALTSDLSSYVPYTGATTNVDLGAYSITSTLATFKGTVTENPSNGTQIITATADRDFSSATGNWTGTNWSISGGKYNHIASYDGASLDLAAMGTMVLGKRYKLVVTVTTTTAEPDTTFVPMEFSIGGESFILPMISNFAVGTSTVTIINQNPITDIGSSFSIAMNSDIWEGSIDDIAIYEFDGNLPTVILENSDGSNGLEIRSGGSDGAGTNLDNFFIGAGTGMSNTTGNTNTVIGSGSMISNTTGSGNTSIGSYNLFSNISGYGNIAVGEYTLANNTTGSENISIGLEGMYNNTTGSYNIVLGSYLSSNLTGSYNLAIFNGALDDNVVGNNNIAIGYRAGKNVLGDSNLLLGNSAGRYETGSNTFYLDNRDRTDTAGDKAGALFYGTFSVVPANQTLRINATTTVPVIIGGSATTSTLTLQSTSGVGTTGADIIFKVGNNGATEAMRILNSGLVTINSAATIGAGVYTQASYLKIGAQGAVSALVEPFVQINTISLVGTGGGTLKVRSGSADTATLNVNSIAATNFKAPGNQPTIFSTTDSSGGSGRYAQAFFGGTAVYNDAYRVKITPAETTHIGLIVKGLASQTANLTEWQNSSGTVLSSVSAAGYIGAGLSAPLYPLHIRGAGATKATTALYVDNSATTQIFRVNNDGSVNIGVNNTLTNNYGIVIGYACQTTGENAVSIGYASYATGTGAISISPNAGSGNSTASGAWSTIAGGLLHKAAGQYSTIIGGLYGSTTMYSQTTFGHDRLVGGTGSFQTSIIPLVANITGTAQTELLIKQNSAQAIIPILSPETNPAYTMWNATITVNAFTASVGNGTGTLNECFGGEYRCIVRRAWNSTTVTMVGSGVQTIYEDADTSMATGVVTIDGDSTTGALRVKFTPPTTAGSTTSTYVGCTIQYLQTFRS